MPGETRMRVGWEMAVKQRRQASKWEIEEWASVLTIWFHRVN